VKKGTRYKAKGTKKKTGSRHRGTKAEGRRGKKETAETRRRREKRKKKKPRITRNTQKKTN